jgi:hypothetical protein
VRKACSGGTWVLSVKCRAVLIFDQLFLSMLHDFSIAAKQLLEGEIAA